MSPNIKMVLNQLFVIKPTDKVIKKVLGFYGLVGLNDKNEFTSMDMDKMKTVEKFKININEIGGYYLPCKKNVLFKKLTNKKCITIARQFLKTVDHDIIGKEKWINNKKYIIYKVISKKEHDAIKKMKEEKKKKKKEIVITFD